MGSTSPSNGEREDSGVNEDSQSEFEDSLFANRSDKGTRNIEFELDSAINNTNDSTDAEEDNAAPKSEADEIFQFIKDIPPPELVTRFARRAPSEVQAAFRTTLRGMLGSLSPALYDVTLRTFAANLVQLMQSCIMNGYMLRSVEYRISLTRSLGLGKAPKLSYGLDRPSLSGASSDLSDEETEVVHNQNETESDGNARLTGELISQEPRIVGDFAVFENEDGSTTEVPISDYVKELRREYSAVKGELDRMNSDGMELIRYIHSLEPKNLEELTASAGSEVIDAMQQVVRAVLQSQRVPQNPFASVETNTVELGQLLFWLMVVGYSIREAEVRLSMRKSLESAPLPPSLGSNSEEPNQSN
eukprot:CAMPEP_0182446592 /NCGR_PEP_ID=MMETSP1172-20130603/4298_1 /TAXON_ID=708627 /ORGANISM="Timspurckia oligopyrenoides, Strain CCMP3278" /LENGTH=359 /DNA_ID=CAMNT_0024642543 /DNA_START=194 /DNA_END=1273 /DNA_ORIENTATION=-